MSGGADVSPEPGRMGGLWCSLFGEAKQDSADYALLALWSVCKECIVFIHDISINSLAGLRYFLKLHLNKVIEQGDIMNKYD